MMDNKNFKILKNYIISLLCIMCFFILDNTCVISEIIEKSSRFRYSGFPEFLLLNLIKYGLLILGVASILIISFFLIRQKRKIN